MSHKTAIVVFQIEKRGVELDLEIPLDIRAHDLIILLNEAFSLGIDLNDMRTCYLKADKPPALLKGSRTLSEFGIRNASIISF